MTEPTFRPAVLADRERILEIAAQTWDGEDYIPEVIDQWLAPGPAQVIVATLDGRLAALARYDRTFPGYAWFEGLRTDPAHQNRGLGKALTGHLIARARADGASRIGLSTYVDNYPSQRVVESYGFRRVATFVDCSADVEAVAAQARASSSAVMASREEAAACILESSALRLGQGFLPHNWRFYPFARDPKLALGYMAHILAIRDGNGLAALLCVGDATPHGASAFSIDFLEGDPDALLVLVRHALTFARGARYIEAMAPSWEGTAGVGLEVLQALGIKPWYDGKEDVFVYELDLSPGA